MTNLKPSMIGLDKGLNLQTAKIAAPAGSVLDTLNYEQVDFQGQKRIDGYARYDGSLLASLDEYLVIVQNTTPTYTVGSLLATDSGMFGVLVSVNEDNNTLYVAVNNQNNVPAAGNTIYTIVGGINSDPQLAVTVTTGVSSDSTPEEHYQNLVAFNNYLKGRVEGLPGPVAGLHWFRDRLHAVAGLVAFSLEGTTPQIYPQDILTVQTDSGSVSAKVLDSYTYENTRLVFLSYMNPEPWQQYGSTVTRDGSSVGELVEGYEDLNEESYLASIYESRSEAQVLEEDGPSGPYDFGWRFIALGWKVLFKNGVSLYGSLPSINQNIENIGIQGPTPVTGVNGKLLTLEQGEDISGEKAQVNGWKSTQSRTTYNLAPANLAEDDTAYIYADAFISWDGATGEVVSPGLTEGALEQRDASNTIEVEIDP